MQSRVMNATQGLLIAITILQTQPGSLQAQSVSVTGRVVDVENGVPIPGVHVFLASTTYGTTTDNEGRYIISDVSAGSYTLVVSIIGYEAAKLPVQFLTESGDLYFDFELKRQIYELDGVEVIGKEDRAWQRHYDQFRKEFIGSLDHADETEILNPEVLDFKRNSRARLSATASEPLLIENRSLGYRITYVLDFFEFDSQSNAVRYRGDAFFEELLPESEEIKDTWVHGREVTYKGSVPHLFASIIQGRTFEEGFMLYRSGGLISSRHLIISSLNASQKEIAFSSPLRIVYTRQLDTNDRAIGFFKAKTVEERSMLLLKAESAIIEVGGFYSPTDALLFGGAMAKRRISDLLPRNYGLDPGALNRGNNISIKQRKDLPADDRTSYQYREEPGVRKPSIDHMMVVMDTTALDSRIVQAMKAIEEEKWMLSGRLLRAVLGERPGNMAAHYWQGIRFREIAKVAGYVDSEYFPNKVDSDWERAIDQFEWVISRDSSYADVLYQYALLWRYAPRYPRALELAERQVSLRPELNHVHLGLFKIYQAYSHNLGNKKALRKLSEVHSIYADFARADVLRRMGRLDEAENILQEQLSNQVITPSQPVLLALARTYYDRALPHEAQRYVQQAIDSIRTVSDALFVFEEIKYILTPEEYKASKMLNTPESYQDFFNTFWTKRDPIPADEVNQRMVVHYRRLKEAEKFFVFPGVRTWHTNPDVLGELPIPESVGLNEVFNDKGLVYIRHGEPDDKVVTIGEDPILRSIRSPANILAARDIPFNESWRYNNPRMDFHFSLVGGGSNWRLQQGLQAGSQDILVDRDTWGGVYADLSNCVYKEYTPVPCRDSEWISMVEETERESRKAVEVGLSTDRHTWEESIEHFEVPFFVSTFREAEGETAVEIYYELPTEEFSSRIEEGGDYEVELGCTIHDLEWQLLDQGLVRQHIRKKAVRDELMVGSCRFIAFPDVYHLAFHGRLLSTNLVSSYKFDVQLPDYRPSRLNLSDIVPATVIKEADRVSRFNKGDLYVKPNPRLVFSNQNPVHLYYEIYNLTLDESGQTRYRVEYSFTQEKNRGIVPRLQKEEVGLSVSSIQTGEETSSFEFPELDVSSLSPGVYAVNVEVVDELSGESMKRSIRLELTK